MTVDSVDGPRQREATPDLRVLIGLGVLEVCLCLVALSLYKKGDRGWSLFLPTTGGRAFVGALVVAVVSFVAVRARFRAGGRDQVLRSKLAVLMNATILVVSLLGAELMVRLLAEEGPFGPVVAGKELRPYEWRRVSAQISQAWRRVDGASLIVYDSLLGWTVGPGRASSEGPYFSSVEGLRSPTPGIQYDRHPTTKRVALVGDSFTFGLEVPYDDTFGAVLDTALGDGVQVLNFGVDGYGVDQAYLRYVRDARPWNPDVVVLGIIDDDLYRTLAVYPFLMFGFDWPLAKPRFTMSGGELRLLNVPVIRPEDVVATPAIDSLPHRVYDTNYDPSVWKARYIRHSYLVRLVISAFPRWPVPNQHTSVDALRSVNAAIVRSFVDKVSADGAVPVIVYLPTRSDFDPAMSRYSGPEGSEALRLLRGQGGDYQDMTPCVEAVEPEQRFVVIHYSREANEAVAQCLLPTIAEGLDAVDVHRIPSGAR